MLENIIQNIQNASNIDSKKEKFLCESFESIHKIIKQ